MSAEDWLLGLDPYEHDGPTPPSECKFCRCEIYWIDSRPYDDDEGEQPHECPARVASVSEFKAL